MGPTLIARKQSKRDNSLSWPKSTPISPESCLDLPLLYRSHRNISGFESNREPLVIMAGMSSSPAKQAVQSSVLLACQFRIEDA